ncbi:MAG TPA: hypothetical protein H9759_01610 [Candidatus Dietzia intestinipullorum]|nr:hypothetical protein [Candidatus Dietzia intestinipullorum]
MSLVKKAASGLAVAAMAAGMTLAGTGAANAAVPTPHVLGNTVTVNVDQPLPGQTCIGMLVPPYAAADLAGAAVASGGDLMAIVRALGDQHDVISLAGPGAFGFNLPATLPGQPGVLFANNVPSNVYALAVVCVSGDGPAEPHLFPAVVGGPLDAFGGSVAGSTGTGNVGGGGGTPVGDTGSGGSSS